MFNFFVLAFIAKLPQMKLAEKKEDKPLLFKFIFWFFVSSHFVLDLDREFETQILNSPDISWKCQC